MPLGSASDTGPRVEVFERAFADYVQARHAVAFANGTGALDAAEDRFDRLIEGDPRSRTRRQIVDDSVGNGPDRRARFILAARISRADRRVSGSGSSRNPSGEQCSA